MYVNLNENETGPWSVISCHYSHIQYKDRKFPFQTRQQCQCQIFKFTLNHLHGKRKRVNEQHKTKKKERKKKHDTKQIEYRKCLVFIVDIACWWMRWRVKTQPMFRSYYSLWPNLLCDSTGWIKIIEFIVQYSTLYIYKWLAVGLLFHYFLIQSNDFGIWNCMHLIEN